MTSQRESRAVQAKVERLLVAVVAAFAVCWLPMHLMLLVDSKIWNSKIVITFSQILAYSNSCLNPILYNFTSKRFRLNFKEIICCALCVRQGTENRVI